MITVRKQVLLTVFLLPIAHVLSAAETDYELSIGGTYSDNVGRSGSLEESDTIVFVGLGLDITHESKRIIFDLASDLKFNHYSDDSFDEEVVGALNADAEFAFVPEVLSWVVADRFGKLQTNPFLANTADNRGNINSFSTGPDLALKFGNRMSLLLGGRLTMNDFEERDSDNDTVTANAALSRAISPNRSFSLSVTWDDIDYREEGPQFTDYQRSTAFVSFNSQVTKGSLSIAVGANEVEILDQTLDGTLARFSFARDLSARTSFQIGYDQQYSNSGDIFRNFQGSGIGFGETVDIPGDGEPFESRQISTGLNFSNQETSFYIRLASDEGDYDSGNSLARQRNEIRLGFSTKLGSNWDISGSSRFARSDYENVDREDDDVYASLALSRRLSRTLYLSFGYNYADRSSNSDISDYTENRYTLTLRFDPE